MFKAFLLKLDKILHLRFIDMLNLISVILDFLAEFFNDTRMLYNELYIYKSYTHVNLMNQLLTTYLYYKIYDLCILPKIEK